MHRWSAPAVALVLGLLAVAATACGSAGTPSASTSSGPHRGGTITALNNGGEWPTLDPAGPGSQPAADTAEFTPIYGQLFAAGPHNSVVPSEARGYHYSDGGLQLDVTIRSGIRFSDGTAFDARAVASSIKRDLAPSAACVCADLFSAVKSVQAVGTSDVRFTLSKPDSAIISSFVDNAPNYTVDPTALAREGESAYGQRPVGAGPFEVVTNVASTKLVLRRNPTYFDSPKPYLNGLTIDSTTSDQSDLSAMQAGQAQVTSVGTISLFQRAPSEGFTNWKLLPTDIEFVKFNEKTAPFDNPIAREAVVEATDERSIIANLYGSEYSPIQGWTAPGMLFYEKRVPGFLSYNVAKAKQLVAKIPGGLSFTIDTTSNTTVFTEETEALVGMWSAAGIHAKVQVNTLQSTITETENGDWQAFDAAWGCGVDPSTCAPQNLASNGLFSGIHDPTIDSLLNAATATSAPASRAKAYDEVNARLASQADIVPLYARGGLVVTTKRVHGIEPYPTSGLLYEDWEDVWLS